MTIKFLTLQRLSEFLNECKALFASQTEVLKNDADIDTYVLNIDYSELEFDTSEIIKDYVEDVELDEDEAMLLLSGDTVLVDANEAYITILKGE